MATGVVRLYPGEPGVSEVVGFSPTAQLDERGKGILRTFFEERGHEYRVMPPDERPDDSISASHVEVRPPMSPQVVEDLGILCTGHTLEGQSANVTVAGEPMGAIVDTGHNNLLVIDNRQEMPTDPLHTGGVLIGRA